MISLIDAGPGTGKTFSLIYGYLKMSHQMVGRINPTEEQQTIFDYLQEEFDPSATVCFFAHSRSVKEKLQQHLKRTRAKVHTLHGAGQSVLIKQFGYQRVVSNRTERHIKMVTGTSLSDMNWDQKKEWLAVKRLCHYLKTEAMEPDEESFDYLLLKYPDLSNYTFPDDWQERASDLLYRAAIPDGFVEYADMPWMAKKHIRRPKFDLGFVDESQDVANSTYQLLVRLCRNVVFCGDKNQAINAFAGASEEMYEKIKQNADAILPLKMTQRCPPAICDYANEIRPGGIIPGPNTHKAIIKTISKNSLPEMLTGSINPANSLFVSRTNATIINLAIWMHTKSIPFTLVDKDLKDEISRFLNSLKADSLSGLKTALRKWLTRMERCPNPFYVHSCQDKYNYISTILSQCNSLTDINTFLEESFSDRVPGFRLTSCHKAKGLEAQNIFIVNPPIPLSFAMNHPIARDQELNLDFVARTRSSQDLYLVK